MIVALPTPGTNDLYTASINEAIRSGLSKAWEFPASGTATLDTAVNNVLRMTFAAGATPAIAFTNPVDGRKVRVMFNVAAAIIVTPTWPAGTLWPNGEPVVLAGRITTVRLRYDSTLAVWVGEGSPTPGVPQRNILVPVVHTNANPTPIDATFEAHEIILTATNTTVSTPTNPVDGQGLEIMYYRGGAQTIAWPASFRWAGNAAPAAPTAATRNYYRFKYKASSGLWYEVSRSINVPNA